MHVPLIAAALKITSCRQHIALDCRRQSASPTGRKASLIAFSS